MTVDEAVKQITTIFYGEPFDDQAIKEMTKLFRQFLPGDYEVTRTMDNNHQLHVSLKFKDDAETPAWMLRHV